MSTKVNIRPGVSVLSVLRHLNYKPWFALAEFVDNAVQSYLANEQYFKAKGQHCVTVSIEFSVDDDKIIIKDDAAGIALKDFPRAFRAAAVPTDRTGLSEFGMGMKSAACWFAPEWSVRTSALGETIERLVELNIADIVDRHFEELPVWETKVSKGAHYTEISLEHPYKLPYGKTISKIRDHLSSIYRTFIRAEKLRLVLNGEDLVYETPTILSAPFYKKPDGKKEKWLKEIEFQLDKTRKVYGFAALRETGSTSRAGFSLFRRNRLIEGSGDEPYRPEYIFGKSNSYTYQRLFGELHLVGFEVSHTKDGFKWEELEEPFLIKLKEQLDAAPTKLLQQAEGHRARTPRKNIVAAAQKALGNTTNALAAEGTDPIIKLVASKAAADPPTALRTVDLLAERQFDLILRNERWEVTLELSDDESDGDWLVIADRPPGKARKLRVRMSIRHPFMQQFVGADFAALEGLVRVGAALALSEIAAREGGVRSAGTIRRNINYLLRFALANE